MGHNRGRRAEWVFRGKPKIVQNHNISEVRVAQSDLCFTELSLVAVETGAGQGRYWEQKDLKEGKG